MKVYMKKGRLGNQLFQFAHIYSKHYEDKSEFAIDSVPSICEGKMYFSPKIQEGGEFCGWNESENYFNTELIRELYSISDDKKKWIEYKFGDLSNSLFITIRRGDFYRFRDTFVCLKANFYEKCYKLLSDNSYDKVILTSDDIEWVKNNVNIEHNNKIYLEGYSPMDTIFIGSVCKDFIISSSTFGWWCAWLGEINGGRILCPSNKYINGYLPYENSIFFPDRWEKVDIDGCYEK